MRDWLSGFNGAGTAAEVVLVRTSIYPSIQSIRHRWRRSIGDDWGRNDVRNVLLDRERVEVIGLHMRGHVALCALLSHTFDHRVRVDRHFLSVRSNDPIEVNTLGQRS